MLYLDSAQKNPSAQQALSTTGYSLDLFHTRTTRKLLKKHFHEIRFYDNIKAWIYVLWKNTKTEYISYIMFDTIILLLLVKLSKVEGKLCTFLVFYLFMFTVQLLLFWQCHCSSCIIQSWFFDYQRGISALWCYSHSNRAVKNSLLLLTARGKGCICPAHWLRLSYGSVQHIGCIFK